MCLCLRYATRDHVLQDIIIADLCICRDMDYIVGVTVLLGIVLRCMVSLHPYSGNSQPYHVLVKSPIGAFCLFTVIVNSLATLYLKTDAIHTASHA